MLIFNTDNHDIVTYIVLVINFKTKHLTILPKKYVKFPDNSLVSYKENL